MAQAIVTITLVFLFIAVQVQTHPTLLTPVEDGSSNATTTTTATTTAPKAPDQAQAPDEPVNLCAEQSKSTKLGERYVFDVIRKKCVSTLAPDCPQNMELRSIPGNESFVLCDCVSHRPAVYNCSTDGCDLLYQQEYCDRGQWLLPTTEGEVICTPNECNPSTSKTSDSEPPLEEYTWFKGECAVIGYPNPNCGPNTTLVYRGGELEAVCVRIFHSYGHGSGNRGFALGGVVPNLQCSPGTKWSQLTHNCQTPHRFNLS